jgi:hypothetical protein
VNNSHFGCLGFALYLRGSRIFFPQCNTKMLLRVYCGQQQVISTGWFQLKHPMNHPTPPEQPYG